MRNDQNPFLRRLINVKYFKCYFSLCIQVLRRIVIQICTRKTKSNVITVRTSAAIHSHHTASKNIAPEQIYKPCSDQLGE